MGFSQFKDRIQLQGLTPSSDSAGGNTGVWVNTVEVWAKVEPLKGTRLREFTQIFEGKPFQVTFRFDAVNDVNNIQLFRAIHNSRALHFHSIIDQDERNTWMKVAAEMSQSVGTTGADFLRQLNFVFSTTSTDSITFTAGPNQAGTYTGNTLTNVASVVYKVNTVVKTLPFAIADTDSVEVAIIRTIVGTQSIVILNGVA